jgi:hypothetical protein
MDKFALRKNQLNADLHVHAFENPNTGQDEIGPTQESHMKSIISTAILRGLDLLGIVSHNSFDPGWLCQKIIADNGYDIVAMAGMEVPSAEKIQTVVFNGRTPPTPGEPVESICQRAHSEGGTVLVVQPSRRNVQRLNKVAGTPNAPDFVEIFNDQTQGGYLRAFVDTGPDESFQLVMDSAAKNATDLADSVMMTRVPREFLVERGMLGKETGVDYEPPFLARRHEQQGGKSPWNQPSPPDIVPSGT